MREEYNKILLKRSFWEQAIYKKVAQLEQAKANNKEREKLIVKKQEMEELLESVCLYQYDVKRFKSAVEKEDREFKNRRICYVNELVTEALKAIFPCEQVKARLQCDFYRKSEATLTLLDKNGNELIPDICSGKLQQYLISFAAVSGIAQGLGVNSLFVDEAFGVAAPEILGEIGKVIQARVASGMQVLMIAQNPGVYQDLPRREIELCKNPVTEKVEIVSIKDY